MAYVSKSSGSGSMKRESGKAAYRVAVSESDEIVKVIRGPRCHCKCAYDEKKELHLGSPYLGTLYKLLPRDGKNTIQLQTKAAGTLVFKNSRRAMASSPDLTM